MKKGIALLGIIPIRKSPSDKTEMVSQLLFGETYDIKSIDDSWIHIKTDFDNYTGYIDKKCMSELTEKTYSNFAHKLKYISIDTINTIVDLSNSTNHILTPGCELFDFDPQSNNLSLLDIEFKLLNGKFEQEKEQKNRDFLIKNAYKFLNTPYLWGGRTPFGIDCSGYTQVVYKISGYALPRDAYQQAESGKIVETIKESLPSDLMFFKNNQEEITHVGIYLGNNKIIHASGKVKIDNVNERGIYDLNTSQYTHCLKLIRRIIP